MTSSVRVLRSATFCSSDLSGSSLARMALASPMDFLRGLRIVPEGRGGHAGLVARELGIQRGQVKETSAAARGALPGRRRRGDCPKACDRLSPRAGGMSSFGSVARIFRDGPLIPVPLRPLAGRQRDDFTAKLLRPFSRTRKPTLSGAPLFGPAGRAGIEEMHAVVPLVGGPVGVAEEEPVAGRQPADGEDVDEVERSPQRSRSSESG